LQETKLLWILHGLKDKSLADLNNLSDPDENLETVGGFKAMIASQNK